ncbi:aldo/keto reductase [Roseospirillum parvum]|uniref:Predicted oxidoreductase n=1 Tax=Roseospirillum parvum TaxID=83401 RepID=A0A1G7TWG3_9PROT|nr:aldo/keto reductase [Roseospirillum parvum]SDG39568.1 Predicted oxidoreductase [Roseospirillum parvum]
MEYRPLGRTGLTVSALSLGTMTFGEQNSQDEAFAQLDMARDAGINFIDAAELYPISPKAETQGRTEEIIGNWLKSRGRPDDWVIATKVVGPSPAMPWFRGPDHSLGRADIEAAVDASLRRLGVEAIDLYYLHWPARQTNTFGRLGYTPGDDADAVPLADSLAVLGELVRAGKIRHVALSNETPWGLMTALKLAEQSGLPRPACIQNPYSLVNRSFEVGLAEIACREAVGLAAYSPLAGGVLSGKYLDGGQPPGARLTLWPGRYGRYTKPAGVAATRDYVGLARRHGLDPCAMALAYVMSRPFVTSAIAGATSTDQLAGHLAACELTLPEEVLAGIEDIQSLNSNPCP